MGTINNKVVKVLARLGENACQRKLKRWGVSIDNSDDLDFAIHYSKGEMVDLGLSGRILRELCLSSELYPPKMEGLLLITQRAIR